jgi:acyl-CoA reductase-like NAD-dependent aldehyde dehydrogenase
MAANPEFSRRTLPVFDPSTGEQIAEVTNGGNAEVDAAVRSARASFDAKLWRGMPGAARARILWRVADVIEQHYDELASLESRNNGMPKALAAYTILGGAEAFRYYAGWVTKIHGQTSNVIGNSISGAPAEYHAYTRREPIGVAGLITPWNVPIAMACNKLAPALAAGCSVVLKPAEETPLTTMRLGELLLLAGIPDGVVNVVTGYGETAGAAMSASTRSVSPVPPKSASSSSKRPRATSRKSRSNSVARHRSSFSTMRISPRRSPAPPWASSRIPDRPASWARGSSSIARCSTRSSRASPRSPRA